MPDNIAGWPLELIAAVCERHGVRELAWLDPEPPASLSVTPEEIPQLEPSPPGSPAAAAVPPPLHWLVEFVAPGAVNFADLMDLQDEFAEILARRVCLVPQQGLGAARRKQIEARVRVLYRT